MSEKAVCKKSNDLLGKIISLYSTMEDDPLAYEISRSSLSILSIIDEADRAQGNADFIRKLEALKTEINKFLYYLGILKIAQNINEREFESINTDATEVVKMINTTVETAKSTKD